ncbi:hypothetical protein COLO4_32924 [Corchorus olitorius]|uniref:RRM domain-containing protein n=1 Tax=Corchorus olitorius TaxID=93759 RepID=A0A1R3GX88_9ROSI|nr:hypothetical protein COLO4_32924 [Corchorus olitorius]
MSISMERQRWGRRLNNQGGRKHQFQGNHQSEVSTVFVNNIPPKVHWRWLTEIFQRYGDVMDVFIPQKRRKRDRKFGFVRFSIMDDARRASSRLNRTWLLDYRIGVNVTRFNGRLTYWRRVQEESQHKEIKNQNENDKKEQKHDFEGLTNDTKVQDRKEHEKGLVEDVLDIDLGKKNNGDMPGASYKSCDGVVEDETLGKLEKCVIGLSRGFYEKIVQVLSETAWVSCFGVPIHAWNPTTFKNIAELWGDLVSLNESTLFLKYFSKGVMLLMTDQQDKIEETIVLCKEKKYFSQDSSSRKLRHGDGSSDEEQRNLMRQRKHESWVRCWGYLQRGNMEVGGLGNAAKRKLILQRVKEVKVNVFLIQESKQERIEDVMIQSIWPGGNYDWIFAPSTGKAGGLFNEFIHDGGLIDLPLHGKKFTWYDAGRSKEVNFGSLPYALDIRYAGLWWNMCVFSKQDEEILFLENKLEQINTIENVRDLTVDEIEDKKKTMGVVFDFFKDHFAKVDCDENFYIDLHFAKLLEQDADCLKALFTMEENDLLNFVLEFQKYGRLDQGLNSSFIALILKDKWCGDKPLKLVFPRLFSLATNKNAKVCD